MDLYISYKLCKDIETKKHLNSLTLKSEIPGSEYYGLIVRESCCKCGQNPYFCQCFNITHNNGRTNARGTMVLSFPDE